MQAAKLSERLCHAMHARPAIGGTGTSRNRTSAQILRTRTARQAPIPGPMGHPFPHREGAKVPPAAPPGQARCHLLM